MQDRLTEAIEASKSEKLPVFVSWSRMSEREKAWLASAIRRKKFQQRGGRMKNKKLMEHFEKQFGVKIDYYAMRDAIRKIRKEYDIKPAFEMKERNVVEDEREVVSLLDRVDRHEKELANAKMLIEELIKIVRGYLS